MTRDLKDLYRRKAEALRKRPALARASGHASVRLNAPVTCRVEHEDRVQDVDLPPDEGGTASGPHPGQLMRASLGACLAMGYGLWAARLDVPVEAVSVDVTCDYDSRGQMGLDPSVAVGWQRICFDVTITSAAAEDEVRRVVETADRLSPMLANLNPGIERLHRLTVIRR